MSFLTLVLLSASVFADERVESTKQTTPLEQSTELKNSQFVAGYNAPARVKTSDGWDMFTRASFLYWNVFQEGMELGFLLYPDAQQASGVLEFPDEYKSGFKVGLGWNTPFDNWVVSADYTWFHHSIYKKQPADLYLASSSHLNVQAVFDIEAFINSSHKWHIDLDVIDMMLGRPFYQGTRVNITPSFGLKGIFLNQKYTLKGLFRAGQTFLTYDYMKSDSWAVGPSLRVDADFLLGAGIRLTSGISGTATFTRYNGIRYFASEDEAFLVNIKGSPENRVRAVCEAEAGLSWGMYLCQQKYHIDFSAAYEFQVFWNQNMISWYAQNLSNKNGCSPGNLYFQGLTLSGTFDF